MRSIMFLITSTLLTSAMPAAAQTDPFVEINGTLIVEAESSPAYGDWSLETDIEGFKGTGYHVWRGQNNLPKNQAPDGNPIQYHFRITTPGNYQMRWRSRNTVGLDKTEHNDNWIKFPTGQNISGQHGLDGWTKVYMSEVQTWSWESHTVDGNNQPVRQYFSAGDHVMEVSGRSTGHGVDRLSLFQYESIEFDIDRFNSMAESPRLSAVSSGFHTQEANTCYANTLSLPAVQDAHVSENSLISDDTTLTISANGEYGFVQFDLPSIPSNATSIALDFFSSEDNDGRSLSIYQSSGESWTPDSDLLNLPYPSVLLAQHTIQSGANGSMQTVNLPTAQFATEQNTLVLVVDDASTPISIRASETLQGPRLRITGGNDFCNTMGTSDESDQDSNGSDTDNTSGDNSEETDVINTDNETDNSSDNPFAPVDTSNTANTQNSTTTNVQSSGGASYWIVMALALLSVARVTRRPRRA